MKTRLKRIGQLTCLMLILTSSLLVLSLLPRAVATLTISGLVPSFGSVGTRVGLSANITTIGGQYEVRFDEELVANGTAAPDNLITTSFTVPQATASSHVIMVKDLATGENATSTFTVTTAYSVDLITLTKQFQESDSIPILVNMTGAESGKTYATNVTVQTPSNTSYVKMLEIASSTLGNGTATVNYPNDFPTGANTSFVGNYGITVNATMANMTFSVLLTNSTEYHRAQTVNIKALYAPNENVTLTITGKDINQAVNLTDPAGLINYNWSVPQNASIATYSVNIVSLSGLTTKNPPDTQNFTIPGFGLNVTAKNLAGNPVSSVNVAVLENGTSVANTTTSSTGVAQLTLEIGNYTCTGYLKTQEVGELNIEVNDTGSVDLVCNLTNLRVQIVSLINGAEINIPDAEIYFTPDNSTLYTDINGTVVVHSLLPNATYTLNMTRYNTPFNFTAIPQLLINDTPVAWFDLKVNVPILTLNVTAVKSDGQPLGNILVKIQEMAGMPLYEGSTDVNGNITFSAPLGKYTLRAYDTSGIILNSTAVDLFVNKNISIHCDLYDLTVSVQVVDYFGQGIANVNVKLQREGQAQMSKKTQADGVATFDNIVGGDMEVTLYLGDSSQPILAQGLAVENSTTVQFRMDQFVVFAGLLVETSQLATIIIVVLIVILVLMVEVYRRRRSKTQKSEAESPNKES